MIIHFDIIHMCHINFYKKAIYDLKSKGNKILITYLDRGEIEKVLKKEFPGFYITKAGDYVKGNKGKPIMALKRIIKLSAFIKKHKPDVTTGVGDFPLAIASRLKGKRCILFYDDYEFKINFNLSKLFASRFVFPEFIPSKGKNVRAYKGFKELAYLHLNSFTPCVSSLNRYNLKEKDYVFVREVAGISMNYDKLEQDSLLQYVKLLHSIKVQVVLSLEDKSRKKYYEPYCIILEEPVDNIYSLMYYSKFGMSSGDSVARELVLLGVHCIYTGGRDMVVNRFLIENEWIIKEEEPEKIKKEINRLVENKYPIFMFTERINNFDDTTEIIKEELTCR